MSEIQTRRGKKKKKTRRRLCQIGNNLEEVESDIEVEKVRGGSCGTMEKFKLDFNQLRGENRLLKEEICLLKEENRLLKQEPDLLKEKSHSSEAGSKGSQKRSHDLGESSDSSDPESSFETKKAAKKRRRKPVSSSSSSDEDSPKKKPKKASFGKQAMWTEGADINVEGHEREDVSFQCSHKFAWNNNKYLCSDPCKDSKDTLVTVGSGGRAESGRITLKDLGNGVFTVTFSQLQLSDSGTYWCAVDRPGFDTYTAVHLTVNKAVINETTTVIPEVSHTWAYQNISYSTQMPPGMDTSRATNILTASNCTNGGEQNISTSTVLFATFSALSAFTILVVVMCFRKRRKNTKPQPQVCSTDTVSTDKGQVDCEYDEIGEEVQSLTELSTRVSCSHHPKQDPPTSASAAADGSVPPHIYENIRHIKHTAGSRYSGANVHNDGSGTYVKPLPAVITKRTGDGSRGKRANKPTATRQVTNKPTESCACNASACDSKETGTRSLWFGLDLSGTV